MMFARSFSLSFFPKKRKTFLSSPLFLLQEEEKGKSGAERPSVLVSGRRLGKRNE